MVLRKNGLLAGAALAIGSVMSGQAQAIEMWHSNTVWANQGMCAASFTFDSGLDEVRQLQVHIQALDKKTHRVVAQEVMEVEDFGRSNADRYATGYWYGEMACDDDLRLVVTRAYAVVDGERMDLLSRQALDIRPFVPYEITIQTVDQAARPAACLLSRFHSQAVIQDKDGYSNVRAQPNGKSEVIEKLFENDVFYTFEQKGNWWQVCTPAGHIGYLYYDRIRLQ